MKPVIERLRSEFLEMPGLRLTAKQVERLCGVEQTICQAVLNALVEVEFLRLNSDGTYARLVDGGIARPHHAKAEHRAAPTERGEHRTRTGTAHDVDGNRRKPAER
jgi:hypothetical protein